MCYSSCPPGLSRVHFQVNLSWLLSSVAARKVFIKFNMILPIAFCIQYSSHLKLDFSLNFPQYHTTTLAASNLLRHPSRPAKSMRRFEKFPSICLASLTLLSSFSLCIDWIFHWLLGNISSSAKKKLCRSAWKHFFVLSAHRSRMGKRAPKNI